MNRYYLPLCITAEEVIENCTVIKNLFVWFEETVCGSYENCPDWLKFLNYVNGEEEGQYIGSQIMIDYCSLYGSRKVSKFLLKNVKESTYPDYKYMIDEDLCFTIYNKFSSNWQKVYEALFADYNPIHNYDMDENENVGSYTEYSNDTESNVYGFNSSNSTPVADSGYSGHTEGDFDKNRRKLTRSGNIGVKTTQSMIQEELALRKEKFIDIIFKDLNTVFTRPNY